MPPAAASAPGGLSLLPPQGGSLSSAVLETPYENDLDVESGVLEIQVTGADTGRVLQALFAGNPARVADLLPPTDLTSLNGLTLEVVVGAGSFTVTFSAPSGTTEGALAAQIERQCDYLVNATFPVGGPLRLESADSGSATTLTVDRCSEHRRHGQCRDWLHRGVRYH